MTHLAEHGCFSTSDTGGCNLHLPSPLSCLEGVCLSLAWQSEAGAMHSWLEGRIQG